MILKYKLKKGDVSKYTTVVHSLREAREGNYYEKLETKMEMAMTQKVIEENANGDISLNVCIDSSIFWKDGKEVPIRKKEKIFTMKMASNGEVIESSGTGPQSPSSFPDKEVNPGDIWNSKKEISVPSHSNGIILKTIYKFDGFEKFNGFDCAKILVNTEKVNLTFDEGVSQEIGGHGLTYFAYGEGKLIKSEVNTYTTTSLSDAEIKVTTQVIVNYLGQSSERLPGSDFLFL